MGAVVGAFHIPDGSIAAYIFSRQERRTLDCLDLVACVPCVQIVHDVFQNYDHFIVFVQSVNAVIKRDETAAEGWKHVIGVLSALDIITSEAAEVFGQNQIDLTRRRVLHQLVESASVKGRAAYAVITVVRV